MQLRPLPARVEDEDEDDEVAVNADSDAGDTAASVLHPPSPTFIYSDAVWRSPLRARRLRAASLGNVAINDGLVEYRNSLRRVPSPPATLMRLRSVKPLPLSSANSRTPRRARQAAVQQDVAAATDGEVDQLIDTRLTLSPPRAHIDDDSKRSSNHSITPIHTNLDTTRDDGGDHDRIDSLPSHLISSSISSARRVCRLAAFGSILVDARYQGDAQESRSAGQDRSACRQGCLRSSSTLFRRGGGGDHGASLGAERHVGGRLVPQRCSTKCLSVWSDVFMNLVMQQPVPPPAPETNEVLRLIRRASQRHPHCFTAQLLDFVRGQPPSTTDPANAASANDPFASYFASRQPVPFNLLAPTPLALPPLV
ncbi:hypothetical protein [Sporisorium scitamineum]|uniref:Uncharacterized protein n=1 Tax=Sporisorium scitamineum TaxID=49012 RepID=A0A0F7RZ92_9BASI|nr:hypothetical protein [Sporisorium scitamineum]